MSNKVSQLALAASLSLANAFGLIGGSVGLNALVKSNKQKTHLRKSVPPGTRLIINTDDVLHSGIVIAVVCASIGVITFASLGLGHLRPSLEASTRKARGYLLGFFTLWLLPTQIAFTIFFATRRAIVRAFIGGNELPQSVVRHQEQLLGTTSVYKEIYYLRLLAILPWAAFLFASIATVLLLVIPPETKSGEYAASSPSSEIEKTRMSEHEHNHK